MARDYVVNAYIIWNLEEAQEELSRTISELSNDADYDEAEFSIAMAHVYDHLNTAWNARNATPEDTENLTDETFSRWRAFPKDIDMD